MSKKQNKLNNQSLKDLRLFDHIYTGIFTYPAFASDIGNVKPVQYFHRSLVDRLEKTEAVYNIDNMANYFYKYSQDKDIYYYEDFPNITPFFNSAWFEYKYGNMLIGFNCSVNYIDDQVYDTILNGISMTGEDADKKFTNMVNDEGTKEHWAGVRDKLTRYNNILSAENYFNEIEKSLLDQMSMMLVSSNKDYQHPKVLEFIKEMKEKGLRYILSVEGVWKDEAHGRNVEGPIAQWVFYIDKHGRPLKESTYNTTSPNENLAGDVIDTLHKTCNRTILPLLFALNMANYNFAKFEPIENSDRIRKYRKVNSIKNKQVFIQSYTMSDTLHLNMSTKKVSLKTALADNRLYFQRPVDLNIFSKWKAIYWLSDKVKEVKVKEIQKELLAKHATMPQQSMKDVTITNNQVPTDVYNAIRAYNKV